MGAIFQFYSTVFFYENLYYYPQNLVLERKIIVISSCIIYKIHYKDDLTRVVISYEKILFII